MKNNDLPRESLSLTPGVILGAGLIVLSGCNSSSSTPPALEAQAVDGYLVNSTVYCDDVVSGLTGAAGYLSCPSGTELYRVAGGTDVGFDPEATAGGSAFVGELSGSTRFPFVTPLSTLVVEMASTGGEFDSTMVDGELERLKSVFSLPDGVDLGSNPTLDENIELIKFNAQVQEVLEGFSTEASDYADVVTGFSNTIKNAADTATELDLATNIDAVVSDLNLELVNVNSDLTLNSVDLDALANELDETVRSIENSTNKEGVTLVASNPSGNPALTINRDNIMVRFGREGGSESNFDIAQFEDDVQVNNQYQVLVSHLNNSIGLNRESIIVNQNLDSQSIDLAFEIDATDNNDARKLSVIAIGATATMTQNDNTSVVIGVPDGTELYVTAVDSDNTSTNATFTINGDKSFSSENSMIQIDLSDIEQRLADRNITGFLDRSGNYQVKMVVGGVQIGQSEGGGEVLLDAITVQADGRSVSGYGLLGYATFFNQ